MCIYTLSTIRPKSSQSAESQNLITTAKEPIKPDKQTLMSEAQSSTRYGIHNKWISCTMHFGFNNNRKTFHSKPHKAMLKVWK